MADQLAEGDGRPVGAGRNQSSQDGLAEARVSPSGKELEELWKNKRDELDTSNRCYLL